MFNFPLNLDISNYVDNNCVKNVSNYNLYGIINHIGTFNLGHYCAYIKPINENVWYNLMIKKLWKWVKIFDTNNVLLYFIINNNIIYD